MNEPHPPKRPYNAEDGDYLFDEEFAVASSSECTGMIPAPAKTEAQVESYNSIYDIPLAEEDQIPLTACDGEPPIPSFPDH